MYVSKDELRDLRLKRDYATSYGRNRNNKYGCYCDEEKEYEAVMCFGFCCVRYGVFGSGGEIDRLRHGRFLMGSDEGSIFLEQ